MILIDVVASIAQGKIVKLDRKDPVAKSMLARKPYKGVGYGRYIDEADIDSVFADDGKLKAIEAEVAPVVETPGTGLPVEDENAPDITEEQAAAAQAEADAAAEAQVIAEAEAEAIELAAKADAAEKIAAETAQAAEDEAALNAEIAAEAAAAEAANSEEKPKKSSSKKS